jgi:8-oxo-dGTP diphosphatase
MPDLALRLWRILGDRLRWRVLYYRHARFLVAVTAVCWRGERLLLLRHRFWPQRFPWGLPTGHARRGEDVCAAIRREVREEVLATGLHLRIEVRLGARVAGPAEPRPDGREVLEAGFFRPDELPAGLLPSHRRLIEEGLRRRV